MARVIKEFFGRADAETKPRTFKPGDEVTGDLARVAVREGWAEEPKPEPAAEPSPKPKPRATRRRKR